MAKLKNIVIGWGTWLGALGLSKKQRIESERRLIICDACEFAIPSKFLVFINDVDAKNVETKYCTICKCPCHQKSVVENETCPKNKW